MQQQDIIERNIKLMQLSETDINLTVKLRMIDQLEGPISKCNKMKFLSMLLEDKMSGAIKNVDMWLRDVTQKLDNFALQV